MEIFHHLSEQQTGIYSLINQPTRLVSLQIIPDPESVYPQTGAYRLPQRHACSFLRKEPWTMCEPDEKRLYDIVFSSLIIILVLSG